MVNTRDGGFGSGAGMPHERSTGEQDARTGQAAQAREVQRLRQQGRGLRTQAVYQDGVPVGTETVVVDAVRGPTSGVRGASGQRTADASAELGAYAPRTLTRAEMVALIGEDGVARAEAAEGMTVAEVPDPRGGTMAVVVHDGQALTRRAARVRKTPRVTAPAPQTGTPIPASEPASAGAAMTAAEQADPTFTDDVAAGVEMGLTTEDAVRTIREVRAETAAMAPPVRTAEVFDVDVEDAEDTPSAALTFHGAEIVPDGDYVPLTPPDTLAVDAAGLPTGPQRAASDTDTPSRGVPKPIDDPGKKITGGFGEPTGTNLGEAGYFPFDGLELQAVVASLCARLTARAKDDLRFSRAIVYPRVSVRLELVVEAYGQDEAMTVPVVWAPAAGQPGTTAAALAAQHADELVFIIRETLQEFDAAGNPETPPNAAREDLGLAVPRKQRVKAGRGWQVVDRV